MQVPVFIGILNGSFLICMADFIRKFKRNCETLFEDFNWCFLCQTSFIYRNKIYRNCYPINWHSRGSYKQDSHYFGRYCRYGSTLGKIYEIFRNKNVKQLKIATLFFKPTVYRKELPINYIGKNIDDRFIVGYGLITMVWEEIFQQYIN